MNYIMVVYATLNKPFHAHTQTHTWGPTQDHQVFSFRVTMIASICQIRHIIGS